MAMSIIITNPDTFSLSDGLSYIDQKRNYFTPFAIHPDNYGPANANGLLTKFINEEGILLFPLQDKCGMKRGIKRQLKPLQNLEKFFLIPC